MSLWAIVPVKPFSKGKSRLADLLSLERRVLLNSTLLTRTIRTLKLVPEIHHIIIVSRDSSALAVAHNFGVKTIQEDSVIELNKALKRAATVAQVYSANSILIVPSDLPLLEAGDVSKLLGLRRGGTEMIIAPDRHMKGTNALYLSPPNIVEFKFGPKSFDLHMAEAKNSQITCEIFENINFGLDIDLPQDLELLSNVHNATLLEELMIDDLFQTSKNMGIVYKEEHI